ncbi:MAG: hypothetical protein L7U52_08205 [Alphaproteobacteria bacterium]|nr:hypothetical protein [Alphaproteobacteria bacterium]
MSKIQKSKHKQNIAGECIIPLLGVLFTVYYVYSIVDAPWTAQVNAVLVGTTLILVSALFLIKKFSLLITGTVEFKVPITRFFSALQTPQAAFIATSFFYLIFIDFLGFTLTTALFFWFSMMILGHGKRPYHKACLSIIMALIGYAVFIVMFETRLPISILEQVLGKVFS